MGNSVLSRLRRIGPRQRPVLFAKAGYALHAMITSVGYEVRRPGDRYDWHGLRRGSAEFVLLQHTLSGEGRLTFEGQPFTVRPGQTLLLTFPHDNRYWLPADAPEPWAFFYLCLNGSEAMRAWRAAIGRRGPVQVLGDQTLDAAAAACCAVLADEVTTPGRASALAYDLAMRLVDEALPRPPVPDERPGRDPAIQRAIEHCRQRIDDPGLGVAHLADAAGYSRFHFSRRFRDSEGMSPGEFILREKMKRAVHLLQSTREPVKTISRRAGFADPNYFGKAFRRVFGVSPGAFRRSGMFSRR